MKILVLCAAGASSTFVAQRIRKAAGAAGLDWHAEAGVWGQSTAAEADVVLLGPHLADRCADASVQGEAAVVVLPDDIFTDFDGHRTLRIIHDAFPASLATEERS